MDDPIAGAYKEPSNPYFMGFGGLYYEVIKCAGKFSILNFELNYKLLVDILAILFYNENVKVVATGCCYFLH